MELLKHKNMRTSDPHFIKRIFIVHPASIWNNIFIDPHLIVLLLILADSERGLLKYSRRGNTFKPNLIYIGALSVQSILRRISGSYPKSWEKNWPTFLGQWNFRFPILWRRRIAISFWSINFMAPAAGKVSPIFLTFSQSWQKEIESHRYKDMEGLDVPGNIHTTKFTRHALLQATRTLVV